MTLLNVVVSVLGLTLIVFVHELFHLLAAKALKIKATSFSVGFGPSFLVFQKGREKTVLRLFPPKELALDSERTSYHLRCIPFGGFVSFARKREGVLEDGLNEHKPWKRIIVAVAGPIGNLVFAVALAAGLMFFTVQAGPHIQSVISGSPAEKMGLHAGDRLKSINGERVYTAEQITAALLKNEEACVEFKRGGELKKQCEKLDLSQPVFKLGIQYQAFADGKTGWSIVPESVKMVAGISKNYTEMMLQMFSNFQVKDLSGPIGVVSTMQETVPDPGMFVFLMIYINAATAFMNLLFPSSITDGGRILVDCIAIARRKHSVSTKYVDIASVLLVLALLATTTFMDIKRLIFGAG